MKKSLFCSGVIICLAQFVSFAQTPASQQSQQKSDDDIVRINTDLIQVDVSVTDKNGRPLPNLRAEDFQVLVNGKPQKITNFLFIGSDSATPAPTPKGAKGDKIEEVVPPPLLRIRPEQVRRSIALVIDDLHISAANMSYVRKALKNFVDAQMEPGDLVAIVRVGKGSGILQRFTADKRELYSVIDRLRYNLAADRVLGPSFSLRDRDEIQSPLDEAGPGIQRSGDDSSFVANALARDSLSVVNYVAQGMRDLPGRKAVLLISEGFPLAIPGLPEYSVGIREAIKRLVDSSARSGVVISTMNPTGLEAYLPSDVITSTSMTSQQIATAAHGQFLAKTSADDGLIYLSKQTGGLSIYNSNDLKKGIRKVLDDLRSYYLIGFQPDAGIMDQVSRRFNELKVEARVSNVNVRYRSGFFGIRDRLNQPAARTAEQQIVRALTSPFGSTDINIRLTPLFSYDRKSGPLVRSLVHISTDNLTFTQQPNGVRQAIVNILACTFDNGGVIVDSLGEKHTLTLSDEMYRRGLTSGFVYSLNIPIKKTGDYQLRVAVQDAKTLQTGTASQFISIPDVKKGRLAVSGIALSSYDPSQVDNNPARSSKGADVVGKDLLTKASARRFRAADAMQFAFTIYNAMFDKTIPQPRVTTKVKLFRDGKEVYASADVPFDPAGQTDLRSMVSQGSLRLTGLEPGDYVLQIIVFDIYGRSKSKTATNWIDFEIIK